MVAMLLPAVSQVRAAARRVQSQNNVRQVALATLNYESVFQKFPSNVKNDDGETLHSWRTELLPFMEQNNLSDAIDRDLAWDEGANAEYTSYEIPTLLSPRGSEALAVTHYVAVVGDDTVIRDGKVTFGEILDGSQCTAFLIEYPESDIKWGEPRDVTLSEAVNIIQGSELPGGTVVGMASGEVIDVPASAPKAEIIKLFNCSDGVSGLKPQ